MNREMLDRVCERGLLGLVLAILVFGPLALGAVPTLPFLVIHGLTLGVLVLWGVRLWVSPRPTLLWPPLCWAVLAFTAYVIVRYLTADIEYVARQELIQVLIYAALFLAITNNLHRQEMTQVISFTLVFLAMAISFYALYQFLTGSNHVWHLLQPPNYRHRASGTYVCPNNLAGFLEMLLPMGLAYTLAGRLKPVTRILMGYAALAIMGGILVTLSRGGWAATGLALLLLFGALLFHRNYRLPAALALMLLLGAGAFLLPRSYYFQRRLQDTTTDQGLLNDSSRFLLWQPAVRVWRDHPWWGGGPAHFDYLFRPYRPEATQVRPELAHNDYLNTLADYGLAGLALVAVAWVALAIGAFKTGRCFCDTSGALGQTRGSNRFALVLGASFGLAAILFHSLVDFNLHIPANAILAVTLMALLTVHLRFTTERYWLGLRARGKVLASLLLLASCGYLGYQGWRHAQEYRWLEQARRSPLFSPEQVTALTAAFAVEPMNADTAQAIGEALRVQSRHADDAKPMVARALEWYQRSCKLNPLDSHGFLGAGLCLDWLGRQAESAPYFDQAERLDPNSYFTVANIGLHYVNVGDYASAKPWFARSLRLEWKDNPIANSYAEIVNLRLQEAATNSFSARLLFPPP